MNDQKGSKNVRVTVVAIFVQACVDIRMLTWCDMSKCGVNLIAIIIEIIELIFLFFWYCVSIIPYKPQDFGECRPLLWCHFHQYLPLRSGRVSICHDRVWKGTKSDYSCLCECAIFCCSRSLLRFDWLTSSKMAMMKWWRIN
jgi:hypothetical protein